MTDRELNALPTELASQLQFLDRKVRGLAALRGMGVVCVVLCVGVAGGVLIDWLFDLGVGTRVAMLLGVCGAALVAAAIAVVRPLVRRVTSAELAALVDTSFPDLRERIESTVELANPDLPESQKGSELMRSLLMKETVRKSRGVDFGAAADGASAFRWVFIGVLALLLIVLPFGLSKDGYALMLSRFLTPWRNLERATNLYFEIQDGDRTVARGEDVTIQAVPKWRLSPGQLPDHAWLSWRNVAGETDERRMEWSATAEAYVATLPHVFTSFDYDISAGRTRTRTFHIDVVERPDVTALSLEILPPAYTGRAARTLDGAIGRTEVFERSELTFDVTFNKPIASADLVWLASEGAASASEGDEARQLPLTLDAARTAGQLTLQAQRSGAYAIVLRDEHGLESQPGVSRELIVIGDAPPEVAWGDVDPAKILNIPAIEVRPGENVSLPVRASDDIGLAELALHIEVVQRSEHLGPLEAESPQLGQPTVSHDFPLNLGDFDLHEGDLLSVRARGVDGRPVPHPQEGWSPARLIRIDKDADPAGLQALIQQQQQVRNAIEEIRKDVLADRDQARELESEAAQKLKEKVPFDRQPEVADLARNERDVQQRIEQLAAAFQTHPLQQNIAERTRKIASEPIERAHEHLQQAEAAPPDDTRQQRDRLRKAIGDLSNADKQLEELLKKFDELAALERDLQQVQQLAEQAEQLTRSVEEFEHDTQELERLVKEQELNEQQQRQQQQQLDERQMDLQDEQQDLASALDHLLEERPEILEAARQEQIEQLQQLAEQANELARQQDRLAGAMSREPKQPTPPQARETSNDDQPQNSPQQEGATQNDSNPPATPEGPTSESSEKGGDQPANEPGEQSPRRPPSPVEQQRQMAEDAARQAIDTAREQGRDSDAAKQAQQFAKRALQAAEEAEQGLLQEASRTAQQSAQAGRQTTERMQQATEPFPQRMREQSEELTRRQSELAEQLGEASQSPQQRQDAQRQGQEQIAQQTRQLAEQLAQATDRLTSQPVDRPQAGERAGQATEAARQAEQSQQQAQAQMHQQGMREAAEPAREAARALRQASDQARQASREGDRPQDSPVPGEVGQQVADARRQLDQAAQQLGESSQMRAEGTPPQDGQGQNGQQNQTEQGEGQQGQQGEAPEGGQPPGDGQQPGSNEGQQPSPDGQQPGDTPGDQQPGDAGQPGGREGQSPSDQPGQNGQEAANGQSSSSEAMRRVTESLQRAAREMGLQQSQRSQTKGQNQQSGDSQQGADGPQGGSGARGGLSLGELEAELGRISQRNWGQLPDRVESELQLSQQKKPDADYARLIRLYFEDVARKQSAADGLNGAGVEAE